MYYLLLPLLVLSLYAEEPAPIVSPLPLKEEGVETDHVLKIDSDELSYKAYVGTLPIKSNDKVKGNMFFTSYVLQGKESKDRPVTFCFNGGPGSSSVWLQMGAFGPKRVKLDTAVSIAPPYEIEINPYTLLDITDLVFIDPISTGFSAAAAGEDPKQFHGLEEDAISIADFILQWTSKFGRWDSPKYLAGESYGTLRAAKLALMLHENDHYYLNGLIFISTVLNFQTISDESGGNDLPYIMLVPSYTSAAWYHKKIAAEYLQDIDKALKEAEKFATEEYTVALMKGDLLSAEEKKAIADKLSSFIGLSADYILRSNLRVPVAAFCKELLRDQGRTVGRFDARYEGIDANRNGCYFESDPSFDAVFGVYTATFNQYVRQDLKWKSDQPYQVLVDIFPWNYGKNRNSFVNVSEDLRRVMNRNPNLKAFFASGLTDLATPYFATQYTVNHLFLQGGLKNNITTKVYEGGHMMFNQDSSLKQLKEDLRAFYKK